MAAVTPSEGSAVTVWSVHKQPKCGASFLIPIGRIEIMAQRPLSTLGLWSCYCEAAFNIKVGTHLNNKGRASG